jgi:4-oxalocrotonate tautomerase
MKMPFARLTLIPAPSSEDADRLAVGLTDLIARDLNKRRELTSVIIETPAKFYWAIGAEEKEAAAHLEACVTAGTNSDSQKQMFVSNAMSLLREIQPSLHSATYVVVKELPASDWGFDGITQANRVKQSQNS